jgi:hypothetical protein
VTEVEKLRARRAVLLEELRRLPPASESTWKAHKERNRLASKLRHVENRIFTLTQMRLLI